MLRKWLYGLAAAVVHGGASTTGAALGAMVAGFDVFSVVFWKITCGSLIGGGIVAACAYLSKSPIPLDQEK